MSDRLAIVPAADHRGANVAPSTAIPGHLACAHAVVRLQAEAERAWWRCDACGTPFAPAIIAPRLVDVEPATEYLEYLSVHQLAERIPYSTGAIRNLMSRGVLRLGVHYTKPHGRPIFHWPAVVAWLKAGAA